MNVDAIIEFLKAASAEDYIGEPVSQLEHALQAAQDAQRAQAPEVLVLAALLHDIGHWCEPGVDLMPGLGAVNHEKLGADYARRAGLNPDIATLIELHVQAKRYLTRKPAYRKKLSAASQATLSLQGGAMSTSESHLFEQHPLFRDALQLRAWDEAAKRTGLELPDVEMFRAMLARNRVHSIELKDLEQWRRLGFVHLKGWFSPDEMREIELATQLLQSLPETPGKWMKYFEIAGGDRLLCRVENFLQYNVLFEEVVRGSATMNLLAQLMAEPAALFKEKINFKLPGGQGFSPHQDAPAFTSFGQQYHVTLMLSIDATTVANGCLEVACDEKQTTVLPVASDLTIASATAESLNWVPVETEPGDLVLFDSFLPHRSGPNNSGKPRRALYATYNRLADGQWREDYFQEKRASFPPDVERIAGRHYDPGVFNVGNPVTTDG